MADPIAVLLGDVHFTIQTLELATHAFQRAAKYASRLNVPLILNGDTLDSKAIMRGECVNRILSLVSESKISLIINTGNHDLISEKGKEHTLNFLRPYAKVIDSPTWLDEIKSYMLPYHHNTEEYQKWLSNCKPGSRLIVHQGIQTAFMGAYTVDKTSLPPSAFADFRVIGSHYHRPQTIICGTLKENGVGTFSYIGSPYSITFAEANDGPKGFQILYSDGSLKQMPLNLRKHVVIECDHTEVLNKINNLSPQDLLWLKVSGPALELDKLDKKAIGLAHLGHSNFKLDKIYNDVKSQNSAQIKKLSNSDILDQLIKTSGESALQQSYLMALWREVLNAD